MSSPEPHLHTPSAQRMGNPPSELEHAMSVLLGVVRGIVAGIRLADQEVLELEAWLGNHQELLETWPGKAIAERIRDVLEDGTISRAEADDLALTLYRITQSTPGPGGYRHPLFCTSIEPTPTPIVIPGRTFMFCGHFLYGSQERCEAAVLERGGMVDKSVGAELDYLVLGSISTDKLNDCRCQKLVSQVLSLHEGDERPAVVTEKDWIKAVSES